LIFYPCRIPDLGVIKAPDPGSGSATLLRTLNGPDAKLLNPKKTDAGSHSQDRGKEGTIYGIVVQLQKRVLIPDLVRRILIPDLVRSSVADPGCLSRIPDPDFYPSRIPDPKTATKEKEVKKN
jgi:hypothetical protein